MPRYLLPEEGKEALKEHALGNYLPFTGGFKQNYGIRNFGIKKKPKKGVKFYAVEYRPQWIWLKKSQIYLDSENTFKVWNETEDYEFKEEISFSDPELDNEDIKIKYYKWGINNGFKFYGYKKVPNLNAKSYDDYDEKLNELEKKDPSFFNHQLFEYPTQSFFKIGLTNTTAEKRGYFGFDKENKKKYPNPYKTIFIEKDLTHLFEKVHPADVEGFIYFYLFYKYWKDKLFYFSPSNIDLVPEPHHQKIQFNGFSESFLFENVEDKLKIINEAFTLLESLTKSKINMIIKKMINFSAAWNLACLHKRSFFWYSSDYVDFDNWWLSNDLRFLKRRKFFVGHYFFEKIGFWDKWIPENVKQLKDLFDKKEDEFKLSNTKHYPEISDLKTFLP
tara:strand:+ start:42 stop:1211 length:1170 start_codon:yes stop_codon:yes gene_type:complete